jgi:hypothetical protein
LRKYKYKYFGKNIYTRTRIKEDLEWFKQEKVLCWFS